MTAVGGAGAAGNATLQDRRSCTLVWMDSREATILRLNGATIRRERLESDVPPHHRSTGHVRHDPNVRHGGGRSQTAGETNRLEHLRRFVDLVAGRLEPGDDLLILGPGTVRERLTRKVAESDAHHRRTRSVVSEASPPITGRQLIARLRVFAGAETRRHTVGAYRWVDMPTHRPSGKAMLLPRRVVAKPPHQQRGG